MATITRRGDRYRVQVRREGTCLSKTFLSKKDAEAWGRKTESELERGLFVSNSTAERTLLKDVLERYRTEIVPRKRSVEQLTHRTRILERALGDYKLSALSSSVVAAYRDHRLAEVSPATVRIELSVLSRILNTCIKEWGIPLRQGNPVAHIALPRNPRGRERRLETDEEARLLAALNATPQVQALVTLAIETGMRRGELVQMDWQHIDWVRRTLFIPETKTDVPRTVPLTAKAVEVLLKLRSGTQGISGPVLNLNARSVSQAFRRACRRAGIPDLHFHDLRHEATSRFFELGLGPMEVSAITGHQD